MSLDPRMNDMNLSVAIQVKQEEQMKLLFKVVDYLTNKTLSAFDFLYKICFNMRFAKQNNLTDLNHLVKHFESR